MAGDSDNSAATAAAVSLKLPPFYTSNPKYWFAYSESHFKLRGIVCDETKFSYVVTCLTEDVAERVMRTLSNPPLKEKYAALKAHLLQEYTLSESERAAALLDMPGLGDMKPSHLLTKMLALLPDKEAEQPGIIFRELFLRQLPADVRAHLTDKAHLSLEQLAGEADRFFTSAGQRVATVRAVTARPPPAPAKASAAAAATKPAAGKVLCFFHFKYGDRARKCRLPCDYVPEN